MRGKAHSRDVRGGTGYVSPSVQGGTEVGKPRRGAEAGRGEEERVRRVLTSLPKHSSTSENVSGVSSTASCSSAATTHFESIPQLATSLATSTGCEMKGWPSRRH